MVSALHLIPRSLGARPTAKPVSMAVAQSPQTGDLFYIVDFHDLNPRRADDIIPLGVDRFVYSAKKEEGYAGWTRLSYDFISFMEGPTGRIS